MPELIKLNAADLKLSKYKCTYYHWILYEKSPFPKMHQKDGENLPPKTIDLPRVMRETMGNPND